MVLKLDPKLEAALIELAHRKGVTPEVLALEAIRDRFLSESHSLVPEDEWVKRLRAIASDCGVALSDEAVSSEGIYP
jgi:hypothetical protein